MNIIAYRVRQKYPVTWYYIEEGKENNDPMKRETCPSRA
jgi:hypothetical protein